MGSNAARGRWAGIVMGYGDTELEYWSSSGWVRSNLARTPAAKRLPDLGKTAKVMYSHKHDGSFQILWARKRSAWIWRLSRISIDNLVVRMWKNHQPRQWAWLFWICWLCDSRCGSLAKRQSPKRLKHPEYAKTECAMGSPANDRFGPAAVFALPNSPVYCLIT